MVNTAYIERRCRQLNLEALPALNQLKLAISKNDVATAERIASNIHDFLLANYDIETLDRNSTIPPSSRATQVSIHPSRF